MLQIKEISKTYKTGDLVQVALDKVSVNLRDNEFVAILGPSGSGKTTLLNIIGGLDQYDSGDLIINNVSTKNYKDRDWDAYRNHSIGFVFQSYNLIPHQSVLSNVEMSLTIGGIKGKKRKQLALDALDKVGLKDQAHKKPNQMSGGQMQRVAIARALVNDPKILLADEPTGALDTTTSIQVMDLLKEVANDRLVVMVTHNPELAQEYSNRIVKIKDGHIISDSNPLIINEEKLEKPKHRRLGKASMSLLTALRLSLNNLLTKKARTFLTAFAGSIGIIGIALILSLSTGFQNYIDKIQEDTLTSYPLTFTSETADISSMILGLVSETGEADGSNKVKEQQYLSTMFSSIGTNDLPCFVSYTEKHEDELKDVVSAVRYSYSISPLIYTIDASDELVKLNPSEILNTMYSDSAVSMYSGMSAGMGIFSEINGGYDRYKPNYDLLQGRWPEKYNELLLVLSEPNKISDLLVYSLGLRDYDEMGTLIQNLMKGEKSEKFNNPKTFTYDELLDVKLKLINASNMYKYNEKYDIYEDMTQDDEYMRNMYKNSEELIIVGIVTPNPDSSNHNLNPGVCYSRDLTLHVIDEAKKSELVKKQLNNKDVDVFSGKRFDEDKKNENQLDFQDMITVDENVLKEAFKINIDMESLNISQDSIIESSDDISTNMAKTAETMIQTLIKSEDGLSKLMIGSFFKNRMDNLHSIGCPNGYIDSDESKGCLIDFASAPAPYNMMGEEAYKQMFIQDSNGKNYFLPLSSLVFTDEAISNYKDSFFEGEEYNTMVSQIADSLKANQINVSNSDINNALKSPIEKIYDSAISELLNKLTEKSLLNAQKEVNLAAMGMSSYNIESDLPIIMTNASNTVLGNSDVINHNYYHGTEIAKKVYSGLISLGYLQTLKPLMDAFGTDKELMSIDTNKFAEAFKFDLTEDELSRIMTALMSGNKEKSYSNNLLALGYQNVDEPTTISYFFKDFTAKEKFTDFIEKYNEEVGEDNKIRYTDITGLLMSSVKKIVDSVSYVLIAFVSISLIVSSIMIGIITYISVLERTKEIGILRAIGASKHNISSIFNAETFIVGLLSGLIGVFTTILLNVPINNLIHSLTDNYDINAVLPTEGAITLVIISVVLTLIAGIIPSGAASRKDPVIALRTE